MLKFLPGILLLQAITLVLVLIAPTELSGWGWLRLLIPVGIAGVLTAAWFSSMAAHHNKDEISRLQECHAKEREALRVNAERAKTKVIKQAHQETIQEVRRSSTEANIKVGIAFAGGCGYRRLAATNPVHHARVINAHHGRRGIRWLCVTVAPRKSQNAPHHHAVTQR